MDDRRIEKETRAVEFELSDGARLAGEVFVGLYDPHRSGPQKVGALLNGAAGFLPVRTGDGVKLLNTDHIVLARMGPAEERDDVMTLGEKRCVRLRLSRGRELAAEIYVALESGSRASDYFAQPLRFFLLLQPDALLYLNRSHILTVQD